MKAPTVNIKNRAYRSRLFAEHGTMTIFTLTTRCCFRQISFFCFSTHYQIFQLLAESQQIVVRGPLSCSQYDAVFKSYTKDSYSSDISLAFQARQPTLSDGGRTVPFIILRVKNTLMLLLVTGRKAYPPS